MGGQKVEVCGDYSRSLFFFYSSDLREPSRSRNGVSPQGLLAGGPTWKQTMNYLFHPGVLFALNCGLTHAIAFPESLLVQEWFAAAPLSRTRRDIEATTTGTG